MSHKDLRTFQNDMQQGANRIVCERKPSKQTPETQLLYAFTTTLCPNSIETTHQTLPQNNILAGESGDIQSPNQKKTTRC